MLVFILPIVIPKVIEMLEPDSNSGDYSDCKVCIENPTGSECESVVAVYKAARDAMNGWDPSYGALYYYNPKTATSSWIWSRTFVVTIGNHKFAV